MIGQFPEVITEVLGYQDCNNAQQGSNHFFVVLIHFLKAESLALLPIKDIFSVEKHNHASIMLQQGALERAG